MRVRILQARDEDGRWSDEAYAQEKDEGEVIFKYNLAWDRVGSYYNGKLQESGVRLEEIETVIEPNNEALRWLPVEVVADEAAEAFLEELDKRCYIPKPRPIKIVHPMAEG